MRRAQQLARQGTERNLTSTDGRQSLLEPEAWCPPTTDDNDEEEGAEESAGAQCCSEDSCCGRAIRSFLLTPLHRLGRILLPLVLIFFLLLGRAARRILRCRVRLTLRFEDLPTLALVYVLLAEVIRLGTPKRYGTYKSVKRQVGIDCCYLDEVRMGKETRLRGIECIHERTFPNTYRPLAGGAEHGRPGHPRHRHAPLHPRYVTACWNVRYVDKDLCHTVAFGSFVLQSLFLRHTDHTLLEQATPPSSACPRYLAPALLAGSGCAGTCAPMQSGAMRSASASGCVSNMSILYKRIGI